MPLPAVKEPWSTSRQIWACGSVPDKRGQAGLDWVGQLRFPSALGSSEAKLILCLRLLWGASAKACPPAAAGNCLRCIGPCNGHGSPVKAKTHPRCVHMMPVWFLHLQVDFIFDTWSLNPHDVLTIIIILKIKYFPCMYFHLFEFLCILCIIDAPYRGLLTLKASFPVWGCVSGSITPPPLCCLTRGPARAPMRCLIPPSVLSH